MTWRHVWLSAGLCIVLEAALASAAFGVDGFGSATIGASGMQATIAGPDPQATVAVAPVPSVGYGGAQVDASPIDGSVWQGVGASAASQVGCGAQGGSVSSPSGANAGSAQYVLVTPGGAVVGTVAVACAPGPGGSAMSQPPPPPPTATQVWQSATGWEPLVSSTIQVSPNSTGLTGLSSWFWLSNDTTALPPLTLTVAGYTITATASIQSYTWMFGTGDQEPAYSPGSSAHPAATYTYQAVGAYQVTVIAHYVGSYTISGHGLAPQTVPLRVDVTMGTLSYPVQEARSVLVPSGEGT